MLHSGATDSGLAGEHAQTGGDHLAGASPAAGMFGDFNAAHAFHGTVTEARTHHVEGLQRHQEFLTGIDQKARQAATNFTVMEDQNIAAMREVDPGVGCT
jgi:hypothetical protein